MLNISRKEKRSCFDRKIFATFVRKFYFKNNTGTAFFSFIAEEYLKKNRMIRKLFFLIGLLGGTLIMYGQQFENRLEIGPVAGTSFYLGDANQQLFKDCVPLLGGIIRYPFNNRIAVKGTLQASGVKGYSEAQSVSFNHKYFYANIQGEFNFFPYENSDYNIESSVVTPYMVGGVGFMINTADGSSSATSSPARAVVLNCGMGGKWKINKTIDLSLEWTINKALTDKLEGVMPLDNPYQLNQSVFFNNDFFSMLTLAITFAIPIRQCDCKSDFMRTK